MTDAELNAHACELAGWRPYITGYCCHHPTEDAICMTGSKRDCEDWLEGLPESSWAKKYEVRPLYSNPPSFLAGPEARGNVAELEAMLTDEQWRHYSVHLDTECGVNWIIDCMRPSAVRAMVSATPRQRLMALLRVLKPELFQ